MSKIKIRHGVFETNSSSVHSVVLIGEDAFDAWKNHGAYLNLGLCAKSDYECVFDEDSENMHDIVNDDDIVIMPQNLDEVRLQLPKENYYRDDDDCLLEAGIFPFEAYTGDNGKPSQRWASLCGGLNYIDYTEKDEGYEVEADWYRW